MLDASPFTRSSLLGLVPSLDTGLEAWGRRDIVTQSIAARYRAAVMADSPVAYWRLGESSGTTAADETGSYPGTYVTSPTLGESGIFEGDTAVAFAGNNWMDSGVTAVGSVSLFAGTGHEWSLEIWPKISAGNQGTLIAKCGATAASRTFQVYYELTTTRRPAINLRGTANFTLLADTIEWRQMVITWDGSTARLYANGVFVTNLTVGAAAEETTQRILVGARTNTPAFQLTGRVDETSIYPTALSAARVAAHYAAAGY